MHNVVSTSSGSLMRLLMNLTNLDEHVVVVLRWCSRKMKPLPIAPKCNTKAHFVLIYCCGTSPALPSISRKMT